MSIGFYATAFDPDGVITINNEPTKDSASPTADYLVTSGSAGGKMRIFDSRTGQFISNMDGHLNGAQGMFFTADGRRLISTSTAKEAAKIWDASTWQELLTLSGGGSHSEFPLVSADGDTIITGPPWQTWTAPSWEEIAAAEAADAKATQSY
jgi:WD40 repeat protein